ncbi:MAG: Ig-like domain-containing protein [Bacteroides sp.]|nr:Ig-like domain-containing protein [Bacteroides sp.]
MKKRLLGKVLTACLIMALGALFVNVQGQVGITFVNDSVKVGDSATDGIQPVTLKFSIGDAGKISLDASSKNVNEDVQRVVQAWDSDSVGTTDNAALYGKSFAIVVTSNKSRLQCALGGGLGVRGKNQWRLDDGGGEEMYFTLYGDVGVEFTSFSYNDFNDDGGNGNFKLIDYDSDTTYYLDKPTITSDTMIALPAGAFTMRYETDTLTFTNSDTITSSTGNEGGKIYGLSFDVVEAEAMPLPAGQIAINFMNPTEIRYGNPDGIQPLNLDFAIDASGNISLDASTGSELQDNIDFVNTWDNASVGKTDNAELFGKSFSLMISSERRIQCADGGGLGIQGRNQWRIDDEGKEVMYFTLDGDVGLDLLQFKFNDINEADGDLANFRWMDYDSDEVYYVENWSGGVGFYDVPEGEMYMRYKSDMLTVTTSDTVVGDAGGKLYGLVFNVLEALPKIPAVLETMPAHADTLVPISSDYMILFDAPMDQAVSAAAISISPDVSNRSDVWSEAGDQITISFDDLSLYTVYTVTVSKDIKGTNGLTAVSDTTFMFQTLPDAPTVVYTYPVKLGKQLPLNTPLAIEFSRSMIDTTVQNAISFVPELPGIGFVWNDDHTMVYMISNEMDEASYTVTVSTEATDAYGLTLAEPYTFSFNTWTTSIETDKLSDVVLYPNPASDILQISGVDVASVTIHSLSGHFLKEIRNSSVVDVSDLKAGAYIVTVSDREENSVRKMIVIK